MKKVFILGSLLLLSASVFAKSPTREGVWKLDQQNPIDFIEMDMFDQQILTVKVAPKLANGEPSSPISMYCHGNNYNIQPGEKAVCIINWSAEIVTLTIPQDDKQSKSAGTYKLTYSS